ncbi:sensor domain-containing diguanylate cyclase [Oleiphilus messinensis]|uniref:sensor domain-containing diguanylate cyclase n=1 Tax=Oleiphilus messinensis TaxID=141451 RepID=UPI002FC5A18B
MNKSLQQHSLSDAIQFFEDTTSHLGLNEIKSLHAIGQFSPLRDGQATFQHTDSTYWLTFSAINQDPHNAEWYLLVDYPLLDDITLFLESSNGGKALGSSPAETTEGMTVGDTHPFANRAIDYRHFIFPIHFARNEIKHFYLKIKSSGSINANISLHNAGDLIAKTNHLSLTQGGFYGILLAMIFYNALIFVSIKNKSFFLNAYYLTALLLFMIAMSGLSFQYFWPNAPHLSNLSIPVFIANLGLAIALFSRSFLLQNTRSIRLHRTFNTLITVSIIALVIAFTVPYANAVKINSAITISIILCVYITGFTQLQTGDNVVRYFLTAWTLFFFSALLFALASFGFIADYYANEFIMQIGIVTQILFLNFALAQQMKFYTEKLLTMEQGASQQLRDQVAAKTEQLTIAMQDLSRLNKRLEKLSSHDELTQIANRRSFNNTLEEEVRSARREKEPLSLLFMDVDHFKSFNDRYGHQVGDEALKFIAQQTRLKLHRPKDFLARYGGEEFAIILPNTTPIGAQAIAQSIVDQVQSTPFQANGVEDTLTVSIGVFTLKHNQMQKMEIEALADKVVQNADQALYRAKENGRNQVCVYQQA